MEVDGAVDGVLVAGEALGAMVGLGVEGAELGELEVGDSVGSLVEGDTEGPGVVGDPVAGQTVVQFSTWTLGPHCVPPFVGKRKVARVLERVPFVFVPAPEQPETLHALKSDHSL